MNDNPNIEHCKRLLDIAVRDFVPKRPDKYRMLVPFRDQIAALRVKRASYRIIAALLRDMKIEVSHETVARFCRDVIGENPSRHKRRKPPGNKPPQAAAQPVPQPTSTAVSQESSHVATLLQQRHDAAASTSTPTSWTTRRGKGPRIADPKNV